MARTIEELVRRPTLARSFTAGYRPPSSGLDALVEGEALIVVPDKVLCFGTGGGGFIELSFGGGGGPGALPPYQQVEPSAEWVIPRTAGRYPAVTLVDSAGDEFDADVRYVEPNTIVVTLIAPTAGTAYLT